MTIALLTTLKISKEKDCTINLLLNRINGRFVWNSIYCWSSRLIGATEHQDQLKSHSWPRFIQVWCCCLTYDRVSSLLSGGSCTYNGRACSLLLLCEEFSMRHYQQSEALITFDIGSIKAIISMVWFTLLFKSFSEWVTGLDSASKLFCIFSMNYTLELT